MRTDWRERLQLVSALLVVGVLVACGGPSGREPKTFFAVSLASPTTLDLSINGCFVHAQVSSLVESASTVRIGLDGTATGDSGPECADVLQVTLGDVLGGRTVIDKVAGKPVPVTR